MLLGLWRGLMSEVLALTAWVAAFVAAQAWAEPASRYLATTITQPALRYGVAFLLVIVAVLLLFTIARIILSLLLRATGLELADRLLGAAFGIVRGLLITFIGIVLAGMSSLPSRPWWQHAWLALPLETAVIAVKPWLPAEIGNRLHYR